MKDKGFELLRQRKVIDILIGDSILEEKDKYKIQMPYLSGNDLCQLSTMFGLSATYSWGGGALSRWQYFDNLLGFLLEKGIVSQLLAFMFDIQQFLLLTNLSSRDEIESAHKDIVTNIINKINVVLLLSRRELQIVNGNFVMRDIDGQIVITAPNVSKINMPYVHGLKERCKEDLEKGNYDSVVTKSRTLVEEIFIYVLENNNIEIESKGDINRLYQQVKKLFNMQQSKDYDGRVNNLLSGLEKIVQSIGDMRNMNSDAHGVGSKRIEIREHEAQLIINSAMVFSEYILAVYNNAKKIQPK